MRLISRSATVLAVVAVAAVATLAAGCTASEVQGSPSPSEAAPGLVFDPAKPLDPQMEAAIVADDRALVEEILGADFNPTEHLDNGLNALHRAASSSAADLVPLLVAAGVPLEERVNRQTPLMMAAAFGDAATVTAFLRAGSDLTVTDDLIYGATPIHIAARWGNVDALSAFLAWGIEVDQKERGNSTALIYAAFFGQMDAVQYLLVQGADINWRDDFGDTPRTAAFRMGYEEIADYLAGLGAIE